MVRESTDKEGGREVVGRGSDEGRGMRHDVEKTKGRGGGFVNRKMDHKESTSPFHGIGGRKSTRMEDHRK